MKYILEIEVADDEIFFAEKFFQSISFVKNVKVIAENEVTAPAIMKSIAAYEQGRIKPTPLSLAELKAMIDA